GGQFYRVFFSSRRRHTRFSRDWSSDVCSSDLAERGADLLQEKRSPGQLFDGVVPGEDRIAIAKRPAHPPPEHARAHRGGRLVERSEERRVGKEGRTRGSRDDGTHCRERR